MTVLDDDVLARLEGLLAVRKVLGVGREDPHGVNVLLERLGERVDDREAEVRVLVARFALVRRRRALDDDLELELVRQREDWARVRGGSIGRSGRRGGGGGERVAAGSLKGMWKTVALMPKPTTAILVGAIYEVVW